MRVNDAPRFGWRGLMLDSARHYQSPEFIKQFIDWMALHKLNVLHWHLTDDQAWRLEIKKYPRLTSVGAWRVPAGPARRRRTSIPRPASRACIGGFYTQDQVRDIVAYAAARTSPWFPRSKCRATRAPRWSRIPSSVCSRTLPTAVPEEWGVFTTLFNVDDSTFTFLENVLAEVMELFPSEYIHVGGDEAVKDEWQASAADPGAHAGARRQGRTRAAELLHPAHRRSSSTRTAASSSAGTRSSKADSRRTRP